MEPVIQQNMDALLASVREQKRLLILTLGAVAVALLFMALLMTGLPGREYIYGFCAGAV